MDNAFKPLLFHPVHQRKNGGCHFQVVITDIFRVLNRIDLLDSDAEIFCHFSIDRRLFHAAHTSGLEKAEYAKSHEQEWVPAVKRVWSGYQLLVKEVSVISAYG